MRTVTHYTGVTHEVVGDGVIGETIVNPVNPDDVLGYREAVLRTRCGQLKLDREDEPPAEVTCKRCLRGRR